MVKGKSVHTVIGFQCVCVCVVKSVSRGLTKVRLACTSLTSIEQIRFLRNAQNNAHTHPRALSLSRLSLVCGCARSTLTFLFSFSVSCSLALTHHKLSRTICDLSLCKPATPHRILRKKPQRPNPLRKRRDRSTTVQRRLWRRCVCGCGVSCELCRDVLCTG